LNIERITSIKLPDFLSQIDELLTGAAPRTLIGIVGKPGSGKSTLVDLVRERFPSTNVAIIPMDGYHLSNEILLERGMRDRKGAPDTFDVEQFLLLLKRVKETTEEISFPIFHREIEASVEGEGVVSGSAKVIIIEGNYLLSRDYGWQYVRPLLDQSIYLKLPDEERIRRLIERHIQFGKSQEEAIQWVLGSDQRNAEYIETTSFIAQLTLEMD
jgi:pantothenate kinase